MSSQLRSSVTTAAAIQDDLLEVFGWLDRDPVLHVYLLALLLRDGLRGQRDEYWIARRAGRVAGLAYLGALSGAILPVGDDAAADQALAERVAERIGSVPNRFQVVGPRRTVGAVAARLARAGLAARLERPQIYMSLERDSLTRFDRLPQLRKARPADEGLVFETGADLRAEELEEDPRRADPDGYAQRVVEECREGYTWLWIEDGALRFRASLSALTPDAVQISGVYTPPAQRNRGYAQRGLAELCARMFERTRAASLFVNDFNAPAIAVYRRLGFIPTAEWASVFHGPSAPKA